MYSWFESSPAPAFMKIKVPWLPFGWDGFALRWVILHRKGVSENLIAHELVHIEQQKRLGLCRYLWRYLTRRDFRYTVEFEAYKFGSKLPFVEAVEKARKYL